MNTATIGIVIIVISALGYASNWINWRFLNYKINYLLYYMGAFVHESSHAVMCILTRAKISQYKVFVSQPHVTYSNSKLPILGNLLISIAPIIGGLSFLFLVNNYFLSNQFTMPVFSEWKYFWSDFLILIRQIDMSNWKDWVALFLFLNMGAMIGPSWQDLKNVWILIILLVFIPWPFFTHLGFLAIAFILIGLFVQIVLTLLISFVVYITKFVSN